MWVSRGKAVEGERAAVPVRPAAGEGISPMLHLVAILTFPSSGLYMAFSSSGSDFHIWPKVHSRCELSKLRGRSGRCSWQKTVYGVEYTFLARGAAADPGGARFLVGAELVAG